MYQETLMVNNKTGLHARPASALVELSTTFESEILLFTDEDEINTKSIISVLSGGVCPGTEVRLQVEGPDEDEAGRSIAELIRNLMD